MKIATHELSASREGRPDSVYDRAVGALDGLPDVVTTRPTTITTSSLMLGHSQTFIVHTSRQAGEGDTVFVQAINAEGAVRLVLPPAVTDAIARQRDALTSRTRSATAKRIAGERKAAGIAPGFMRGGKRRQGGKKR